MTNRPLKDVVHSDIKYFQKKLNKYINQGIGKGMMAIWQKNLIQNYKN